MKKIIACLIGIIMCSCCLGCETKSVVAPDYSNSSKALNMFAYVAPSGQYATKERFKEYKDCGFDTMLLLGNDPYGGGDFATSSLKRNLDLASKVGLKIIVFDTRLHEYSIQTESNYGEGKQFATKAAFEQNVKDCMNPYMSHPAFYGVTIKDEPRLNVMNAVGETYNAIKKAAPNAFINVVLLPYTTNTSWYTDVPNEKGFNAYKTYLNRFLDKTDSSYLYYDDYPFRTVENNPTILRNYFRTMQVASQVANAKNAEFHIAIQTQGFNMPNNLREIGEAEIRYQSNAALSFGAKNLSSYVYWQHPAETNAAQQIMSANGEKILYDYCQKVNNEIKELAKAILNFDYAATFIDTTAEAGYPIYFDGLETINEITEFEDFKSVTVTTDVMINKLIDKANSRNGYMVLNTSDPIKNQTNNIVLEFTSAKNAVVYSKGKSSTQKLKNGKLTISLDSGDSVFVIPY